MKLHDIIPPRPHDDVPLWTESAFQTHGEVRGNLLQLWEEDGHAIGLWEQFGTGRRFVFYCYEHQADLANYPDEFQQNVERIRQANGQWDWYLFGEHVLDITRKSVYPHRAY
jgi:hypothetical protein